MIRQMSFFLVVLREGLAALSSKEEINLSTELKVYGTPSYQSTNI